MLIFLYIYTAVQHERAPRTSHYKQSISQQQANKSLKRKHSLEQEDIENEPAYQTHKEHYEQDATFLLKRGSSKEMTPVTIATNLSPPPTPQYSSTGFTYMASPEMIYESAIKVLYMTVKWVRNIPTFLDLPLRDQAILLEEGWSELFILR